MKKLTIEQIDNELLKLMNEQPNFTYTDGSPTGCFYTKGPSTNPQKCNGCIFGQAFQKLGISKDTLEELENDYIGAAKADWLPEEIPDYWGQIQTAQDAGNRWGHLKRFLPL